MMNLDRRSVMLAGAGLVAAPALGKPRRSRARQRVLMISIDGLRPGDVIASGGPALPFLHAMMRRGSYASRVIGVTPTSTYPSHTTLLSGVLPTKHGIVANQPFDPFFRNQDGWYWYYSDVTAPTLATL